MHHPFSFFSILTQRLPLGKPFLFIFRVLEIRSVEFAPRMHFLRAFA